MPTKEQIVDRQIRRWNLERRRRAQEKVEAEAEIPSKPLIAVSRQRGSGGSFLARNLADALGYQLFHREIVEYMAREARVRREIIESLDEKSRSGVELWVEGILGSELIHSSDYFRHLVRVLSAISRHGSAVIVGRGAGFIIPRELAFHLRVVASKETRVENLMKWRKLSASEAVSSVENYDRQRSEFVRHFFHEDIERPCNYDLILNTDFVAIPKATEVVLAAVEAKFH